MVYVHLVVAVLMVLAILTTIVPIRRDPLTGIAFVTGWLVEELALQIAIVYVVVIALLDTSHAGRGVLGHLASALDLVVLAGLALLFAVALDTRRVVRESLAHTPGLAIDVAEVAGPARWCSWWRSLLAWPMPGRHLQLIKNVAYADDGLATHRLDIVRPREPVEGAPVLVYVHGGAWLFGDKREQGRPMMFELASRGWICVTVNYRLSPKATWPDQIVDVLSAIAWVKEHIEAYGGDPGFVALAGGSAGGHLSALAALAAGDPNFQPGFEEKDTSVRACVPFYGVHDMTASREVGGQHGPGLKILLERGVMKTPIDERPELYEAASPLYRVHHEAPPFLVLHGSNDTLVPVAVARTFAHVFRGVATAPVAYVELPMAQHAFDVMASPRCSATTLGVVAFLETVRRTTELEQLWRCAVLEVEVDGRILHPADVARQEGHVVHLVTAYNPGGHDRPEVENAAANAELEAELSARSLRWLRAVGRDESSSWVEPGCCVLGLDREQAAELGRRYGQLAVYEISPEAVSVVWCDSVRTIELTEP
jgi:acetyl esterase/lipase